MNQEMASELAQVVEDVERDAAVRVVIFTGAGDRAFMAGADVSEFPGLTPVGALRLSQQLQALYTRIERSPQPVIAAVNGFAFGAGCELIQACDIAIASENARLGQPEVNLGIIPGAGGPSDWPVSSASTGPKSLPDGRPTGRSGSVPCRDRQPSGSPGPAHG